MSFFIFILLYIYTYIINLIIFILSNIYLFIFNNIIKNKYNLKQQSNILNLISLTKNFLYIFDKKVKVNNNTIFYNFYKDGKVINYKYFYIIHYNFNTNFTNAIYNYVVYISNIKNISVSKYNLNYFNDFQNSFIKNNIIKVSKTYISTFKKKNNFSYFFKKNYLYYIIEYKKKSFFLKNNLYSINFSVSNIIKYLSTYNININFLRKNKIFNKGRYSRNRQTYRTGVY